MPTTTDTAESTKFSPAEKMENETQEQHSPYRDGSGLIGQHVSIQSHGHISDRQESILDAAHPRDRQLPVAPLSGHFHRRRFGVKMFKSSYIALYKSLEYSSDRALVGLAVVLAVAAGVPLPIIGVIFGRLISNFPPSPEDLRLRITELLSAAAGYFVVTAAYTTIFGFTSEKVATRKREVLLDALLHLDQTYLDTHDLDIHTLLTERIDIIQNGCSEKAGIFIQSISYFVAAFTVGFILSPRLAGILLSAVVPILATIVGFTSRKMSKLSKRSAELQKRSHGVVENALRALKLVQAFDMARELCAKHDGRAHENLKVTARRSIFSALQIGCIYFTAYAINGLAFYLGSQMVVAGDQGGDAGTIFAVVLLILDSSFVVAQFAPFMDTFAKAELAGAAIQEILDARHSPQIPMIEKKRVSLRNCHLEFVDVTFAYPARPTAIVLNRCNLGISPGSFTAIVGCSGSGKSTLISLLAGLYNYSGNIHIGGQELRNLDLPHLRRQISFVEQDTVLFAGSIYDNICSSVMGQDLPKNVLEERCRWASQAAALNFLEDLPRGIHTRIGDGLELSGGQKQRICLARALLREPAVLLLDEPTSALDAQNEMTVVRAVKAAVNSGVTVIMVAHRLSTILETDRVVVMQDGHVVEQGAPRALSAHDGLLRSMLEAQKTSFHDIEGHAVENSHSCAKPDASIMNVAAHDNLCSSAPTNFGKEDLPRMLTIMIGLGRLLRPEWPIICLGVMAASVSGGLLLGEAIIFGNLVDLLNDLGQTKDFLQRANFFCLMFLALACIAIVSWVGCGTCFGFSAARLVTRVQSQLFAKLLGLDMDWFLGEGRSVNQLMGAFTKDIGDLSCLSGPALGTIVTTSVSVIGGIILAMSVSWRISVVLLCAVPVMLSAGYARLQILNSADNRRRAVYREANRDAAEACHNKRTVTIFGLESHVLAKYRSTLTRSYCRSRPFIVVSNVLLAAAFAITYFVYALAYWWGAKQVRLGNATQRDFFTVLPALLFSAQSTGQLFSLTPEISRAKAAASSIFQLLGQGSNVRVTGPHSRTFTSASTFITNLRDVKRASAAPVVALEDVFFGYSSTNGNSALDGVSLQVLSGQTVAFVGPSGAGKSTALSLIERFHDPTRGIIRFEGVDIRHLDVRRVRDKMGLVTQEPYLLPGSITYNIRLGARTNQFLSDAEIQQACKQVGMHDFVSSLPDGYNTECGSIGSSKLSGGQRQRLSLARALVRQPKLLLLDEVTSALDAHSEEQIQASLAVGAKSRTTIIVAHRLASIQHADKIYVFDKGAVVETGTHTELMTRGGLYRTLAKAQHLI